MASKSTDAAASISLPKGGGAVKGIGETFQPDLVTGTGTFSVPIDPSPRVISTSTPSTINRCSRRFSSSSEGNSGAKTFR